MSLFYSGNLNDFMDVVERIQGLDLKVYNLVAQDDMMCLYTAYVRVETVKGSLIAEQKFAHYDYDVLVNTCTSWLRGVYSNLKDWK